MGSYVDDLMDFIERAISKQKEDYLFVNVGSGKAISVQNIVKTAIKASEKKLTIENDLTKPTIPTSLSLDHSRATKKLGWKPVTSLEKGLKLTMDWYEKNYA